MGITKSDKFTEEQNELAVIAKALGHPARVAILQYLLKADSCVCGDLVLEIKLAQATVSQHLKELKKVGLIKGTISGPSTCYCIDVERWTYVKAMFDIFFGTFNEKDCC